VKMVKLTESAGVILPAPSGRDPGIPEAAANTAFLAEAGSPYDCCGCGPRLKRLTTWEPERWQNLRDPRSAGLPAATRETMRFFSWQERQSVSLGEAYFAAKTMARGNLTWGNFLVLAGPTGTGKTHLAAAVAWEWFEDGCSVIFARMDDLLDDLRAGYENTTYHQRLEAIRRCGLLVLDDLGTEATKDWAEEKVDRIIDWRYINRLPLVVTTNVRGEELAPRIASRLADRSCSLVIQIEATDYRTEEPKRKINGDGNYEQA
jgi:DNA replication protein DnaC